MQLQQEVTLSKRFEDYMRDEDQPWLPRVEVGSPRDDWDAGWRDGIAWAMGLDKWPLFTASEVMYGPDHGTGHVVGQEFVPLVGESEELAFHTEDGQWWHQYPIALRYKDRDEDDPEEFTELDASPDHARAFWRSVGAQSEEPSQFYVRGFAQAVGLVNQLTDTPYMGRRDQDDREWIASLYRFQNDRPALLDIATRMPERMRKEFFDTLVRLIACWSTTGAEVSWGCPFYMFKHPKVGNVLAVLLGKERIRFVEGGIEGMRFRAWTPAVPA